MLCNTCSIFISILSIVLLKQVIVMLGTREEGNEMAAVLLFVFAVLQVLCRFFGKEKTHPVVFYTRTVVFKQVTLRGTSASAAVQVTPDNYAQLRGKCQNLTQLNHKWRLEEMCAKLMLSTWRWSRPISHP